MQTTNDSLALYGGNLPIHILSHGLKKGTAPKADIYVDARGLPDHAQSGTPEEQAQIRNSIPFGAYKEIVLHGLQSIGSRRANRPPNLKNVPIRICTLCAFGISRSVALKRLLRIELMKTFPQREIKEIQG